MAVRRKETLRQLRRVWIIARSGSDITWQVRITLQCVFCECDVLTLDLYVLS
jgi:hypothetical protein